MHGFPPLAPSCLATPFHRPALGVGFSRFRDQVSTGRLIGEARGGATLLVKLTQDNRAADRLSCGPFRRVGKAKRAHRHNDPRAHASLCAPYGVRMIMSAKSIALLCVSLVAAALLASAASAQTILFEGARIIPGDGSPAIENGALLVEGGGISRVGRKGEIAAPAGAARIDLGGKTAVEHPDSLRGQNERLHFGVAVEYRLHLLLNPRDHSLSFGNLDPPSKRYIVEVDPVPLMAKRFLDA